MRYEQQGGSPNAARLSRHRRRLAPKNVCSVSDPSLLSRSNACKANRSYGFPYRRKGQATLSLLSITPGATSRSEATQQRSHPTSHHFAFCGHSHAASAPNGERHMQVAKPPTRNPSAAVGIERGSPMNPRTRTT